MVIVVISWELHVPAAHSLKEKRSVLARLKARLRNDFNVSVAETGHQDTWQRGELTACLVAGDRRHADAVLGAVERTVDDAPYCRVIDRVRTFY